MVLCILNQSTEVPKRFFKDCSAQGTNLGSSGFRLCSLQSSALDHLTSAPPPLQSSIYVYHCERLGDSCQMSQIDCQLRTYFCIRSSACRWLASRAGRCSQAGSTRSCCPWCCGCSRTFRGPSPGCPGKLRHQVLLKVDQQFFRSIIHHFRHNLQASRFISQNCHRIRQK